MKLNNDTPIVPSRGHSQTNIKVESTLEEGKGGVL